MAQRASTFRDNKILPVYACNPLTCNTCKKYTNPYYYSTYNYCILHCYQCNDIDYTYNIRLIEHNNKCYLLCKYCYKIYRKRLKEILFKT